jgi:hypothetical protein
MKRIDIDRYKPRPHPYRAILRNHGVTNATVANYLGRSEGHVSDLLAGKYKMPEAIKQKLKPLMYQLLEENRVQ